MLLVEDFWPKIIKNLSLLPLPHQGRRLIRKPRHRLKLINTDGN